MLFAIALPASSQEDAVVITAHQAKSLSVDTATAEIPIAIQGTVTCIPDGWKGFFLQDDSGGVYCEPYDEPSERTFWPVRVGELISLLGVSAPGKYNSFVRVKEVTTREKLQLPEPTSFSIPDVNVRKSDADLIRVQGYIVNGFQIASEMEYDLTNDGRDIQVAHMGFRIDPVTSDHSLVEVTGVVEPLLYDTRKRAFRLLVPTNKEFRVIKHAEDIYRESSPIPFETLLESDPKLWNRPILATGRVYFSTPHMAWLIDDQRVIQVKFDKPVKLQNDEQVTIAGFLRHDDEVGRSLQHSAVVNQIALPSTQDAPILSTKGIHRFTSLRGVYLGKYPDNQSTILKIGIDGADWQVRLPLNGLTSDLYTGAVYQFQGIVIPREGETSMSRELFIRDGNGVQLISNPPWPLETTMRIVSFLSAGLTLGLIAATVAFFKLKYATSYLREARAELRSLNESLEATVNRRTHELSMANQKLVTEARERHAAEQAKATSEARLKDALSIAQLGTFYWDVLTDECQWSEQSLRIHGMEANTSTFGFSDYRKRIHPDDSNIIISAFQDVMQTRERIECRYRIITPQGTERWISALSRSIVDENEKVVGIDGVFQDITERLSSEEQLRQSMKMEALGRMAGGIAHDLNNTLTVIHVSCHILQAHSKLDELAVSQVAAIQSASERSARLTKQLLTYSRKQVLRPEVLNVNQNIRSFLPLLKQLVGDSVGLDCQLESDVYPTQIDPGQFEQILMNLVVNARDAIDRQGRIVIQTFNQLIDNESSKQTWELHPSTGAYVCLSVEDTGEGIPPEAIKSIFEPFFTTKPQDKGTGLGLAVIHGIVKQMGGGLRVNSRMSVGTCFEILLPAYGSPNSSVSDTSLRGPRETARGSNERILLVDDENAVLNQTRIILEHLGYRVTAASSAKEAYHLLEKGNRYDLLLTDYSMPEMNGSQLVTKVHKIFPELKVVFMSGFLNEEAFRSQLVDVELSYVQKPFSVSSLGNTIRESLDRTRSPAIAKKMGDKLLTSQI